MPLRQARPLRFVHWSSPLLTGKFPRNWELRLQVNSLCEGLQATDALRAQGLLGVDLSEDVLETGKGPAKEPQQRIQGQWTAISTNDRGIVVGRGWGNFCNCLAQSHEETKKPLSSQTIHASEARALGFRSGAGNLSHSGLCFASSVRRCCGGTFTGNGKFSVCHLVRFFRV